MTEQHVRKPDWLKTRLGGSDTFMATKRLVDAHRLHTICASGRCPNRDECWSRGTATFMIGGDICTRACRFCNTRTGRPAPLDPHEPARVAESIRVMALTRAVVTSVDRDDLPDLAAGHWHETLRLVKAASPAIALEALIPDFQGRMALVDTVMRAAPDVASHNLETVRRLTPHIRSAARYDRSLAVLARIAASGATAKTGIMVGLGETPDEVDELMDDARRAGVTILTVGQYLQPSRRHVAVAEYVTPARFDAYRATALAKGFTRVESAPMVRSSYRI
ncbi:MAG: lipoyl synthase [Tannerella sp.]|jgi:lipoic acid synthetase|nr:lipoyl synthase [Tannerella sp.]